MGKDTLIEWCDSTWNPWHGCSKVSDGCANCYAARMAKRNPAMLGLWGAAGTRVVAVESKWREPRNWNRKAMRTGSRPRVFCASIADVFEQWNGQVSDHNKNPMARVPQGKGYARSEQWCWQSDAYGFEPLTLDHLRSRVFETILATPYLDYLLVTKRPENVTPMASAALGFDVAVHGLPPNVMVLTSVEDQETANARIPQLLKINAARCGLSMEPLLGPVDLRHVRDSTQVFGSPVTITFDALCSKQGIGFSKDRRIDWVIVGGESGYGARPMSPDWARKIRDDCKAAGVPFFFKQWGQWIPGMRLPAITATMQPFDFTDPAERMWPVGKRAAGRMLDGRTWDEFPQFTEVGR